ncbi:MAG: TIR domain-containing protein [Anaerolineae bacterium]|nr:TIR domain-containing protein [Anaerolineae bacterium]
MSKAKLFISYKTGADDNLSARANSLYKDLHASGYKVWLDTVSLKPGDPPWNKQIAEEIPRQDILLVLVARKTAESDWVKREIAVAKGAKVQILPIWIEGTSDELDTVLDELDLPKAQILNYKTGKINPITNRDEEFDVIVSHIESLKHRTRQLQLKWLEEIKAETEVSPKKRFESATPKYRSFKLRDNPAITVHLAAGNILQMGAIDVVVNSENNLLQMGRIFETKSISAQLRHFAALRDEDTDSVTEDTLQDELNLQVDTMRLTRPVSVGRVIVTSAGYLGTGIGINVNINSRYIFHAVTVTIQGAGSEKNLSVDEGSISQCVLNALRTTQRVDGAKGVVSPLGTKQRSLQEDSAAAYIPISSIIFPIFGAGHAKGDIKSIAPKMLTGILEFARKLDTAPTSLTDIYLCTLYESDVNSLAEIMQAHLG